MENSIPKLDAGDITRIQALCLSEECRRIVPDDSFVEVTLEIDDALFHDLERMALRHEVSLESLMSVVLKNGLMALEAREIGGIDHGVSVLQMQKIIELGESDEALMEKLLNSTLLICDEARGKRALWKPYTKNEIV